MSGEYFQDQTKILINPIETPAQVPDILKEAKTKINAKDVRFRLRGWNDMSVVHVPNWIIGTSPSLGEFESELAERVYYDVKEPKRIDCYVGLIGRIGRIKEEKMRENPNKVLLKKLEKYINPEEERILFKEMKNQCEFDTFIERLRKKKDNFKKQKDIWGKYLSRIQKINNNNEELFFKSAINEDSPWMKEKNKTEKNRQWDNLKAYLKEKKPDEVKDYFINAVKDTIKHYDKLYTQHKKYIEYAEEPKHEIVVDVLAFGKFIGVLNFHKKSEFDIEAEKFAMIYSATLAVTYLQWQDTLFENFQKVAQPITAESNFEVIASKIVEGVRIGLRHGLEDDEVFPLLYIPKEPICPLENSNVHQYLHKKNFLNMWNDSYQQRQKPKDKSEYEKWEEEKKLGNISIRHQGLGWKVLKKFGEKARNKQEPETKDTFKVCLYVDNPNSDCGSRSALYCNVKTTGCILLTFENRIYGLLYLHCKKRHFFTDVELNALNTFCVQAAIAIHNTKLFGENYEKLYGNKLIELLQVNKNEQI